VESRSRRSSAIEVVRVARRDEALVDHDLLVDPGPAGVADVRPQRRPRRDRAAVQHVGLFHRVVDGEGVRLVEVVEGLEPARLAVRAKTPVEHRFMALGVGQIPQVASRRQTRHTFLLIDRGAPGASIALTGATRG
jgi:hypothetical protein